MSTTLHPLADMDTYTGKQSCSLTEALMALGNLAVIKFNMLNTNYSYVSPLGERSQVKLKSMSMSPSDLSLCMDEARVDEFGGNSPDVSQFYVALQRT